MSSRVLTSLAVIVISYLVCTALVYPIRALGMRFGILDFPGQRKCHTTAIPRVGGLAIFVSLLLVVWGCLFWLPHIKSMPLLAPFNHSFGALSNYVAVTKKLWALLVGATIVSAVGFIDDVKGVEFSPLFKFLGQIVAALAILPAGIYMDLFNFNPYLSMIISVIWVVGITNSFNLLDNMDGLSSGVALICSFIFFFLVMIKGEFFIALLFSAIIGSILGFFQFNIRGGIIFMGDSGSLLLGYLLGALSLMAHYVDVRDATIFPVVAPLIILGLPLFDTFSVIAIRLFKGQPIYRGDQMHLSHRLVRIGMNMRQAVLFNFLMAFAIAANALLMLDLWMLGALVAVAEVIALMAMVTILMTVQTRNCDGVGIHGK
jgi:UDP-GlcNAc:undecaprenyl-phosphate/decaprenyl-phosphate GlcNAc-1-phosphate transferase